MHTRISTMATMAMLACLALTMNTAAAQEAAPRPDAVVDAMAAASLTEAGMLALAKRPPSDFAREWGRARDQALRILRARLTKEVERTEAEERVAFRHAQGRVMYPFFHWRETDAAAIPDDGGLPRLVAALPRIDSDSWRHPETRAYIDAHVHMLARERLARDADLERGDARWLRAKLRVLADVVADRTVWMTAATGIIARHIEDDGARGIDEAIGAWLARRPPAEDLARLRAALDADRSRLVGTRSIVYLEVGGVPLYLHVREPARPRTRPAPAMLWLHGGSATEGTWWHSPVTAQALHEAGVVVVSVELTTGNRFDRDSDQNRDASAAFQYVMAHAAELGLDPGRIGVAGFSSGASTALLLATRGAVPAERGGSPGVARPAAAIVSGACADPLSASSDGYFRKAMSKVGDPEDFSPLAQLRSGLPPVLAVHGTRDEYCSHADMARFVDRSRALGNDITLVSVDGASHFFGFYHPEGRRQQRAAIDAALVRWGW
jgi:acetyl esterase/lipase